MTHSREVEVVIVARAQWKFDVAGAVAKRRSYYNAQLLSWFLSRWTYGRSSYRRRIWRVLENTRNCEANAGVASVGGR